MRFYKNQHRYYCGVDLHASTMYVCVVDGAGKVLLHRNIATKPEEFLSIISPYRDDLVVGVECMFCWYWLADLCTSEQIPFVLGHCLYMKAISGGKVKNDKIDSEKIALLLKAGMLPLAYAYPKEMRSTRDLMRRRLFFVRKRAELLAHVQMTHQQYNLADISAKRLNRSSYLDRFEFSSENESLKRMVDSDLHMIEHYNAEITSLEYFIERQAKKKRPNARLLELLKSVPGIGDVLSLTLLYEIHNIERFPSVQHFASYSRLVKPAKTSAGKNTGGGGGKIGNVHLKWAFSEASVLYLRQSDPGKEYLKRLHKKHSKAKSLSVLAHKIGRAVYFMIKRKEPFNEQMFLSN